MPETAKKAAAAKTTTPDPEKVHRAQRAVGDRLNAQQAERDAQRAQLPPEAAKAVWDRLTAPFPQDQIEKLPKPLRARDDDRGRCDDTNAGRRYSADGHYCGGYHARAVHLDYVGHAGITMRLNDVLGPAGWDFQPFALDPRGLPGMDRQFFARLTITVLDQEPVTKWDLADNFQSPQEAYGDALRRCAMRFGIGTYLWSKSEAALALKQATDEPPAPAPSQDEQRQAQAGQESQTRQEAPAGSQARLAAHQAILKDRLNTAPQAEQDLIRTWWGQNNLPGLQDLSPEQAGMVMGWAEHLENERATADPH